MQRWSALMLALMLALPPLTLAQSSLVNGHLVVVGAINACDDAGTTDAYACNLPETIMQYTNGAEYGFKANTANTGVATINFNGVGARTIKKVVSGITTDLSDNDIRAGQVVVLRYDGTNMQMISQLGNCPLAGSETVQGCLELATAAETTAGSSTSLALSPSGLRASDFGKRYLTLECVADATALTTGTGKCYIPLHPDFNGWNVVGASGHLGAAVATGTVTVDVQRCGAVATGIRCSGTNVSVFSTLLTIDANEDGTETAAVAAVINAANQTLSTGQWFRVDIGGTISGTPQGLYVTLVLQKP